MQVSALNSQQTGRKLKELITSHDEIYWAVAWATETELSNLLIKNTKKIKKLVVGTDFSQTSPVFLEGIAKIKAARITSGKNQSTFHPKLYCFVKGKQASIIIGSANFTNGGMYSNEEACILLECSIADQAAKDLISSVDTWWKTGSCIDDAYLKAYRLKWEANKKHRKAIEKPPYIFKPTKDAHHPDITTKSWSQYARLVNAGKLHSVKERIMLLDKAQSIFNETQKFSSLSELQRKAIAGFVGSKQIKGTDLDHIEWGWFGSMSGTGVFNNLINKNNKHLSMALDCIPASGIVTEENYQAFVQEYKKAFKGQSRKGRVPPASRLLAMKRPDYFVCLDSANINGIANSFGFRKSNVNLDTYWGIVIEPILQSTWWNSQRPTGQQGKIWDYRAALIDSIFYE